MPQTSSYWDLYLGPSSEGGSYVGGCCCALEVSEPFASADLGGCATDLFFGVTKLFAPGYTAWALTLTCDEPVCLAFWARDSIRACRVCAATLARSFFFSSSRCSCMVRADSAALRLRAFSSWTMYFKVWKYYITAFAIHDATECSIHFLIPSHTTLHVSSRSQLTK